MKLTLRMLASGLALVLLAASCGAGTGESTTSPAASASTPVVAAPQKLAHLILIGDTVRGTAGLTEEEKPLLTCVVMSKYPQGSRIVWRIKVLDPLTNKALDDKSLEYVTLTTADGKITPLKYGGHGGTKENPADMFWAAGYTVPIDYPTGAFNYKVEAKSLAGAVGVFAFDAFKVPAAQLQITAAPKK